MAVWSQPSLIDTYSNRRIDSEFFGPKYIQTENLTRQCATDDLGRLGVFIPGPFGSAFHVKNYDFRSPFRYIRGKDVKPFFLLEDDNRYVPESVFYRLQSYAVGPDDLMISVVGTLGNVSICTTNDTPAIFSCKSTLFRTQKIDPYYLLAFLNCHYGSLCLLRRQRGAVQTGLNIEDLRTVPVPRFGSTVESRIAQDVRNAYQSLLYSKKNYVKAQQLLESELGLDKLSFQKPVAYTARLSEVMSERRANAEYFSPVVKQILSLKLFEAAKPLAAHFSILRGKTPTSYSKQGVAILKTKAIRTPSIDLDRVGDFADINAGLTEIEERDLILASMGVGSLGRLSYAYHLHEKFAIDGTLRILRRKKDSPANIEIPQMLFLSSKAGQELIYRGIVGSTGIISLPDAYLKRIPLPEIDQGLCEELSSLVRSSIEAKDRANHLLASAKSRVEQLIEEAVRK
jgi:type I restriction enzyme S subunit